jgi:hypothetical protein
MQEIPPWEPKFSSASQEILHKFWNPKVHYRFHLSLYGSKSVHSKPTHSFLKIGFNIHSPTYATIFKVISFLYVFSTKNFRHLSIPLMLHDLPMSFFFRYTYTYVSETILLLRFFDGNLLKHPHFPICMIRSMYLAIFLVIIKIGYCPSNTT